MLQNICKIHICSKDSIHQKKNRNIIQIKFKKTLFIFEFGFNVVYDLLFSSGVTC